jgi:serine/threonine-protein kinase
VAIAIAAVILVRRNIRLGRGDRRGATKLALFFLTLDTVAWILSEHHVAYDQERLLFISFAGLALVKAGLTWLFYLALEPVIRRRWPESLISWTRLLSGEWRDPVVGRDVLVGSAAAFVWYVCPVFVYRLTPWYSDAALNRDTPLPEGIMGAGALAAWLANWIGTATAIALGFMVVFFLLRRLLRKDWIVAIVSGLGLALLFFLTGIGPGFILVWLPLTTLLAVYLSVRFGLLAVAAGVYMAGLVMFSPMTLATSAWYFRTGLAIFLFVVVVSFVAFRISLGGRRVLKEIED